MIGLILYPMALGMIVLLLMAPLIARAVVIARDTLQNIVKEVQDIWKDRD